MREKQNLDNLSSYVYQSPYMSLDPYRVNTLTISILVNSDDSVNKQLISAYGKELTSLAVAEAVNQAWNEPYSTEQVRELLNVSNGISIDTEASLKGNILSLSLYIPDEMDPDKALSAINDLLPGITSELSDTFGSHEAKLYDSEVLILSDKDFSNRQSEIFGRLYNMTYQLNYITGLMSSEQKDVYDSLVLYYDTTDEEGEDDEAAALIRPSFITKRGMIIGFVLGCFLYGCAYLLYFAFSGKIFSPAVINDAFGLRTLGECYSNKKGLLNFLFTDSVINRIRHRGHLDLASEVDKVSESVASVLSDEGKNKLLLVSGNEADENTAAFKELLTEKLNAAGIATETQRINLSKGIVPGESAIKNNDGVVILVDQANTRIKEVRDVVEKCSYCNRPILGAAYIR